MSDLKITEAALVAHSLCLRKAYQILFRYDHGDDQKYTAFLKKRKSDLEKTYFRSENNCLPFSSDKLMGKAEIIINAVLRESNLVVQQVHLQRREAKSRLGNYSYEPLIFSVSEKIKPQDRINAAYIGDVLSRIQGTRANKATILLIDGSKTSIKLSSDIHVHILNELQDWIISKPGIPPIIFNKHCPLCPFEESCKLEAEKDDSISLLRNMTSKALKKYESKGIFTIKQLSYLYKPRRRSRLWGDRKPRHEYELQALALRTRKIYTTDTAVPPTADVEIFIDIETVPERCFHYLIGVCVFTHESHKYSPLWAHELSDEEYIWEQFLEIAKQYPTAPIFHYGSYERKVIKELGARYNTIVDDICNRLFNVNTYIFGRIYFPTRTNRLKDICDYLGFKWTSSDVNGLNSIIWRYEYDKTHKSEIRDHLLTYNKDDCVNLKKLKDVIQCISHGSRRSDVRTANDQNQLLNATSSRVVKEFGAILESAHGDYEQSRISLKKARNRSVSNGKQGSRNSRHVVPKSKIDKLVRVPRGRVCSIHKRSLMATNETAEEQSSGRLPG